MAREYNINIDVTPGVTDIIIQKEILPGTWSLTTTASAGETVKFVVQLNTGCSITNVTTYYADEYDDTVQVTTTNVDTQTYTFIMPAAVVYIRAETNNVSGGIGQLVTTGNYTIRAIASTSAVQAKFAELGYNVTPLSGIWNSWQSATGGWAESVPVMTYLDFQYNLIVSRLLPSSKSTIPVNVTLGQPRTRGGGLKITRDGNNITITDGQVAVGGSDIFNTALGYGMHETLNGYLGGSVPMVCNGLLSSDPETTTYSVQYSMKPDDSGVINGPTELTSLSPFTFTYRIKAAYKLNSIVINSLDSSGQILGVVSNSYNYDTNTRTYTVTTGDITSGAKGLVIAIYTEMTSDPNNNGGNSGTGGGKGTYDDSSDPVSLSPIPNISAAQAGLITLFKPTISQLHDLGAYLWTNITDFIENLQKMFSNPMDYLISLSILPANPSVGSSRNIKIGLWETTISMSPITSQWYEFDCGSVDVQEYFGSALDYAPNTKVHAMLPFIGSVPLNTDEVMGKTLNLIYRIDLLSGHCVAVIKVNGDVYYQFTGNCAVSVPLTGADWSRIYGAIAGTLGAGAVMTAGSMAASAQISAASQLANIAGKQAVVADFDYMAGNITPMTHMQAQANAANAIARRQSLESGSAAAAVVAANNTVNQVMGAKLSVQHSGTISGSAGILGNRIPYLMIEYPNQSLPENYKHYFGYPSNMTATLGSISGFTQMYQVVLNGVNGTDSEIAEILKALKEGVYL